MNKVRPAPPREFLDWGLVGHAPAMQPVWQWWEIVRGCGDPLLILGETGTGKRTLARQIALCSAPSAPVEVHLAALTATEQLALDVNLSGAPSANAADGMGSLPGALLLHDIQAAIPELQHRLSLSIERAAHAAWPQGTAAAAEALHRRRLIATSSANLVELVTAGAFSRELFWRINALPVTLPPLRRRSEDLAAIADAFCRRWSESSQLSLQGIDAEALELMSRYSWPGNLHELANCLRAAALQATGPRLAVADLPETIRCQAAAASVAAALGTSSRESLSREYVQQCLGQSPEDAGDLYDAVVKPIERELISQVLQSSGQKQVRAAQRLGISRNTLHKKLSEFEDAD